MCVRIRGKISLLSIHRIGWKILFFRKGWEHCSRTIYASISPPLPPHQQHTHTASEWAKEIITFKNKLSHQSSRSYYTFILKCMCVRARLQIDPLRSCQQQRIFVTINNEYSRLRALVVVFFFIRLFCWANHRQLSGGVCPPKNEIEIFWRRLREELTLKKKKETTFHMVTHRFGQRKKMVHHVLYDFRFNEFRDLCVVVIVVRVDAIFAVDSFSSRNQKTSPNNHNI